MSDLLHKLGRRVQRLVYQLLAKPLALLALLALFVASAMQSATKVEREFWSSQETADFLGVPLSTLRYWTWQEKGPRSYRIGRSRKFKPSDVKEWAERQAQEPKRAS